MAAVLHSQMRWRTVSPTGWNEIFRSAKNTTQIQLPNALISSNFWIKFYFFNMDLLQDAPLQYCNIY